MEQAAGVSHAKLRSGDTPIIDFSAFMSDTGAVVGSAMTEGQKEVVEALKMINGSGDGFAYLQNAGISEGDLKEWFLASKSLFDLSEDEKLKLSRLDPSTNVGYSALGQERLNRARGADMKESFNIRSSLFHKNDFTGCPKAFETAALALWSKAMQAADRYGLACALALDLEPDFFTSKMKNKDLVTGRFLHYPPCDYEPDATNGHGSLRIGEHTDFGLFTFVFIDGVGEGLEVKKSCWCRGWWRCWWRDRSWMEGGQRCRRLYFCGEHWCVVGSMDQRCMARDGAPCCCAIKRCCTRASLLHRYVHRPRC